MQDAAASSQKVASERVRTKLLTYPRSANDSDQSRTSISVTGMRELSRSDREVLIPQYVIPYKHDNVSLSIAGNAQLLLLE